MFFDQELIVIPNRFSGEEPAVYPRKTDSSWLKPFGMTRCAIAVLSPAAQASVSACALVLCALSFRRRAES